MPVPPKQLWIATALIGAASLGCAATPPKITPPAVCKPMAFRPEELSAPLRALPMSDAITPPVLISAINPIYPQRALENGVQGLMHIKCIITENGIVTNCRVILSLPHMDRHIIDILHCRRYKPALLDGRAVAVDHDFYLWFVIVPPEEVLQAQLFGDARGR